MTGDGSIWKMGVWRHTAAARAGLAERVFAAVVKDPNMR